MEKRQAFTLIELMIIVVILGILALSITPKISALIITTHEGATKAKLSAIRSALNIYYVDNDGMYPYDMSPLLTPGSKYLTKVVPIYTATHGSIYEIEYSSYVDKTVDDGRWGYVNVRSENWGEIWVRCTHSDTKERIWNQY